MYLFYHKSGDTTQYSYRWTTGGVPRFANYQHGYKTAPIKNFLSSTTAADSLIVLQGMAGAKAKIEFPNLRSLNGKYIINKAELEFTINDDLATDKFAPISQILLLDGKSQPITDSQVAGYTSDATIFQTIPNFGGYVTNGSSATGRVYRFNISAHLQNMLNGSAGTELILYPIFKNVRSNRVVLYGPKHSKYRAKLNLTYTKV